MPPARFIIRWDDISPYQDYDKFHRLVDLFRKYRIPAVLGVIPDNQDTSIKFGKVDDAVFISELADLEKLGWEIAMHGYQHLKRTEDGGLLALNQASEFAGRPFQDQMSAMTEGKKILARHGFNPVTFIPPWHSYDEATLAALPQAGFAALSDGWFLYPRSINGLMQLPVIFWSAPHRMRLLGWLDGAYTICLHPQLTSTADLLALERFFRDEDPTVVTAAALLPEMAGLVRPNLKRRLFERLFVMSYRRRG